MPDVRAYKTFLEHQGRKGIRRLNKAARADEVRFFFEPLEPFDPFQEKIEVPDDFRPHLGQDGTGAWQRDFLFSRGLSPDHNLLDIGCGDMRGGVPLILYLDAGRYVGVDQTAIALIQGSLSLQEECREREPTFYLGGYFSFERIERSFDFLWANSVWTHIDLSMIGKCMASAIKVLVPGGRFYATYFPSPADEPWTEPNSYRPARVNKGKKFTFGYRNPYHHPQWLLEAIAGDIGFMVSFLDETSPKCQSIIELTKPLS